MAKAKRRKPKKEAAPPRPLRLEYIDPAQLNDNPANWRTHPAKQTAALQGALAEVGWAGALLYNERTKRLIDGHARKKMVAGKGEVPVLIGNWDEETEKKILVTLDPLSAIAEADTQALEALLREVHFDDDRLTAMMADLAETTGISDGLDEQIVDAEPQIDRAAELNKKWQVKRGDLWSIGDHRLLCGDSTRREDVERVMGGEKAQLIHADPPYGMGKEKEGIANDNLYAAKLDKFQMAWWKAVRQSLDDNASAYIWGNAEDLWRLWYIGGLKESERLTMRNEIVWDKNGGRGIGTEALRSYFPTERCLFFMLGEQGFNNNSDNYWEGWEGIRSKLAADCDKMGWTAKDVERICGVGNFGRWFTKSQWAFIPEEHYKKLQAAARGHDAFKREHDELKREHDELKREHDELKREFYATRAYFDNIHDNMTDVWEFPRVTGDERYGHATPKQIDMICRVIKSSTPDKSIVIDPFLGSGTTLIAAANLDRRCFGIEISPEYCAVILQRAQDALGIIGERIQDAAPQRE